MPDYGYKPTNKNGLIAVSFEEGFGLVQMVFIQQKIFAEFFHKGPAAVLADIIGNQRTGNTAQSAKNHDQPKIQFAI